MISHVVALAVVVQAASVSGDFGDEYRAIQVVYSIKCYPDESDILHFLRQFASRFDVLILAPFVNGERHDTLLTVGEEMNRTGSETFAEREALDDCR